MRLVCVDEKVNVLKLSSVSFGIQLLLSDPYNLFLNNLQNVMILYSNLSEFTCYFSIINFRYIQIVMIMRTWQYNIYHL